MPLSIWRLPIFIFKRLTGWVSVVYPPPYYAGVHSESMIFTIAGVCPAECLRLAGMIHIL
jgi:hypothetical protein